MNMVLLKLNYSSFWLKWRSAQKMRKLPLKTELVFSHRNTGTEVWKCVDCIGAEIVISVVLHIHLVVCLTTGPNPLPKRALHIVRSRASSFKWECPLLSLRSSNSFLRLLPWVLYSCVIWSFIPERKFRSLTEFVCPWHILQIKFLAWQSFFSFGTVWNIFVRRVLNFEFLKMVVIKKKCIHSLIKTCRCFVGTCNLIFGVRILILLPKRFLFVK